MKLKLKGFTFIEVMVVLVIIAIMVTAIGISVSAFNSKIKPGPFSYYLKQIFELIEQKAILEQNDFGACVQKSGIKFLRYNQANSNWDEILDNTDLRSVKFPDTLKISFSINNKEQDLDNNNCESPNLIFNTGGFVTPFSMTVKEKEMIYTIVANYGGGIIVEKQN